jgi:hypothetical protein
MVLKYPYLGNDCEWVIEHKSPVRIGKTSYYPLRKFTSKREATELAMIVNTGTSWYAAKIKKTGREYIVGVRRLSVRRIGSKYALPGDF